MKIPNGSVNISVVIPVYNVKEYIKEAVDSILHQSSPPYEVIIINDGSTDGSGVLLEALYGNIDRVKIVHTTNQGLGEARNEGSRYVTGEFTYYFDSDDIAARTLLEEFTAAYQRNGDLDIFCFSAKSFFDTTTNTNQPLPFYSRVMNKDFSNGVVAFNSMSAHASFYPNAWMYVFRTSLLSEHDIRFKPIIHEDEEFTPRLFFKARRVSVSSQILFSRRIRHGSIMQSSRNEKNVIGYIESIRALEQLRKTSTNKKAKWYLDERIHININTISNIIKHEGISLSDELSSQFIEIKNRNKCRFIYLAKFNHRICRLLYQIQFRLINYPSPKTRKHSGKETGTGYL